MSSQWDDALERLWSGTSDLSEAEMLVPFSSVGLDLRQRIARLSEVQKMASKMATLSEHRDTPVSELHDQLRARFPDVPASVCSEILKYTLDPRF